MSSTVLGVNYNAADAKVAPSFWAAAVSRSVGDGADGDRDSTLVESADAASGPRIGLRRVPEPKTVKNRMDFDLITSTSPPR
jgi:hypothetical protein